MSEGAGQKKYILHLPGWYPHPDDPQNGVFIQKQIHALSPYGRQVVLFVKSARQPVAYSVHSSQEENVKTVIIRFRESTKPPPVKNLVHAWRYFRAFRKGMRQILSANGRPVLIHVHVLLRMGLFAKYYAGRFKIPYVVSEHWSGYLTGAFADKSFLYRRLSVSVFKGASKVIVVSELLRKAMVQLGVPGQKTAVVPNVVETGGMILKREKTSGKTIVILSVADLVDQIKKIADVIRVTAELSEKHDIEYRIIGDGPDRPVLESVARQKGVLGKAVRFLGRLPNPEVLQAIGECDFLVVNSAIETFSVVTAEALLAGKPVVATRCGGPEMFVDSDNGILIEPGDIAALKNAVEKMINRCRNYDPARVKQSVEGRFTRENVGRQLEMIYENILDKS